MTLDDDEGPVVVHHSYCRICVAACGVLVRTQGSTVVSVRGDPDNPMTGGYTCSKGRAMGAAHHDAGRLDEPQRRRGSALVDIGWAQLLDDLAGRLRRIIRESGPDAVAMYLGAATSLDANGRRAAEAFMQALGSRSKYTTATSDCPSKYLVPELMFGQSKLGAVADLDDVRMLLIVGANPVVSHGHTWSMSDPVSTLRSVAARGRLWVMDPRRTATARLARGHLSPRPGTDFAVLAYLVGEVLSNGADGEYVDRFTDGVDRLRAATAGYDARRVSELTGISMAQLEDLLGDVRDAGRLAILTGTGATMGVDANLVEWLATALVAITGSLDRRGGMWFNPGYFDRADRGGGAAPAPAGREPGPRSRPELPRRWGQYPVAGLLSELESGNVRALIAVGGNLVACAPQPKRLSDAVAGLEAVAVAELSRTAQVRLATHVLPCTGPLERADVTDRLQRLFPAVAAQYTAAVVPPVAGRRPMWWVFASLAERLGLRILDERIDIDEATDDDVLDSWLDAEQLVALRSTPGGAVIEDAARYGWVVGTSRVLDGRIRLAPQELVDQLAAVDGTLVERDAGCLVLAPRRQPRHLNSLFLPGLDRDEPMIALNPGDAEVRGITDGASVVVTSPHGAIEGIAAVDPELSDGVVSIPHGFTGPHQPNVSDLIGFDQDIDPLTGMMLQAGLPLTVRLRS